MIAKGWRVKLSTDKRGARYAGGFPEAVEVVVSGSGTFARGGALVHDLDVDGFSDATWAAIQADSTKRDTTARTSTLRRIDPRFTAAVNTQVSDFQELAAQSQLELNVSFNPEPQQTDPLVLDIAGNVAVARVETPWFVDHFHMGRYGDRWIIVNALWHMKPR